MGLTRTSFALLPLVATVLAKPLDTDIKKRADPTETIVPCNGICNTGPWDRPAQCTSSSPAWLVSVESRITNPPAPTPSSIGLDFCSRLLAPGVTDVHYKYLTTVSTSTSRVDVHNIITVTDNNHPTSTAFCPIPSANAACGWDSNVIQDTMKRVPGIEENQDPETCQQGCLNLPQCKSFRVASRAPGWNCELFEVALGDNASNLVSSSKGTQWFDRDCVDHAPAGCKASPTTPPKRAARNPADVTHDKVTVTAEAVAKRNWDAPAPDYLKDINGQESVFYFPGACSCLITSPSPVSTSTTTQTIPRYTGTTTVTATFVDNFTVTVTPRSTTTYVSRN